jgi:hypothetical protein
MLLWLKLCGSANRAGNGENYGQLIFNALDVDLHSRLKVQVERKARDGKAQLDLKNLARCLSDQFCSTCEQFRIPSGKCRGSPYDLQAEIVVFSWIN